MEEEGPTVEVEVQGQGQGQGQGQAQAQAQAQAQVPQVRTVLRVRRFLIERAEPAPALLHVCFGAWGSRWLSDPSVYGIHLGQPNRPNRPMSARSCLAVPESNSKLPSFRRYRTSIENSILENSGIRASTPIFLGSVTISFCSLRC